MNEVEQISGEEIPSPGVYIPALPLLQIGQVRNWVITGAHRAGEACDDYVDSEIQTWPQKWRNSNLAVIF